MTTADKSAPGASANIPDAMRAALERAGVDASKAVVADVTTDFARSMEELCYRPTTWPKASSESPLLCVIEDPTEFPEAERGSNYRGYVKISAIADDGEELVAQTWYANKQTGELNPVVEWMRKQSAPFYMKLARIETNNPGRHIVRPIPVR